MRRLLLVIAGLLALPATATAAGCPGYADNVAAISQAFLDQAQVSSLDKIPDYAAARCIADGVVEAIGRDPAWGPPIGYKVGLTSKGMQQRLGIDTPAWGRLTQGMLIQSGGKVPRAFAARPIAEADLMVTIADAGIMDATTVEEAARHVSQMTAFIELADLVLADGFTPTLNKIVAINVGARRGVVGNSLPMTPELAAALPHLTVNMTTLGAKRWDSEGTRLMGHPLAPLVWLVGQLKAEGRSLEAGDVVSLGSFGPPLTPDFPGQDMLVTYTDEKGADLPGGPLKVKVTFSP
jgi:2-keto-4-pentenoate hydratase